MLGKLFTGWFSDLDFVNGFVLYNVYVILSGVTLMFFPVVSTFPLYALLVVLVS